ncbi:unnamed protein product [Urochloa humidicola]
MPPSGASLVCVVGFEEAREAVTLQARRCPSCSNSFTVKPSSHRDLLLFLGGRRRGAVRRWRHGDGGVHRVSVRSMGGAADGQMAVRNRWGGDNSQAKADQLTASVVSWFTRAAKGAGPLDQDELEDLLCDAMDEYFHADLEDGSIEEV